MLLIQIDCCQAVCAEDGGEFAVVMDVVFEHVPENPLVTPLWLMGYCSTTVSGHTCQLLNVHGGR